MYELSVEREFSAAHAILINGEREPVHGHNWRVQVIVAGRSLDSNDLLCDFHRIERDVEAIVRRFDNNNLNAMPPFDRINPTAERVAQHIGEEVMKKLPRGVTLVKATVSEAAGCKASYLPD